MLTQGSLASRLPAGAPPVLLLDEMNGPAEIPFHAPRIPTDALAYVIYTSGSTGRPKGVGVSHASAVPMLRWSRDWFGLAPGRRVLQSLSYAFDFGLWEILTAVVSGAALHIPPVAETGDPEAFARRAVAEGIDMVHATPSFFRAVAETGVRLEGLRVLHLGGEALSRPLVERLAAAVGPECVLYNGYGPTEATVNSLIFAVGRPGELRGAERVPIGRPSADNAVYVVDRRGEPVPVGVPGELWVGGPGVARGYLGRPELTAEKFIPDGFSGEAGSRLYRTGDLARWLPEGDVEFLGRVDHQVKIRGFRVEPGEIEAALRQHAGVREAVVVARGERLVAYVVAGEEGAGAGDLQEFLRGRLPAALVPSAFVPLSGLPLTPTGKVDRRALPEPELKESEGREAARTPVEEILAGIFAEVLGVAGVGRMGSFFHLGGHSLLATRVVSRVREAFGVELPLRSLFEAPTVAALAAEVEHALGAGLTATLPPVERADRGGDLPLSFAQERLWFLDQLEPGSAAYNIPGAVALTGDLRPDALAGALSAIAARHESLRTRFAARDGRPAQIVAAPLPALLPVIDLRALPEAAREVEAERLAREEAGRPFDLTTGPLLRARLLCQGETEWTCLLTLHHIAADGWSMGVLLRELSILYGAAVEGRPSPLPELPVQYADYAVWQRRWLTGEVLAGELAWWRGKLAGAPTVLELPTDRPRPAAAGAGGGRERVELRAGAERLGRRHGATLYMTLLAAFGVLLSRWADQDELLVGSPVAGRPRRELEGLIGFFVNSVVQRLDITGEPTFGELLGRVREVSLSSLAHQELPFERLVEELAPERNLGRGPLFQVMLAVQAAPPELAAPGLRFRGLPVDSGTAKLELSLELAPEGEGIAGWIEYRADLFEASTARRLAGQLATLLAAAVASPETPVTALPLLSDAEREQMLGAWSRSAGPWAAPGTVHTLFEEQARRLPLNQAVVAEDTTLTYRELDDSASRLAELIKELLR